METDGIRVCAYFVKFGKSSPDASNETRPQLRNVDEEKDFM